ncbi:Imm47 family immunity protein [Bacillus cereus group sp. BfR-BA-01380]|uniref:Imm47 family immunity protein n=1 Tax=Bacillus cereus group sp. BfR-BA-01380 TaxID=2920324 RepID=UPI001F57290D|nr:Imm47 family immunity protein [Bacillus cereus group sp. BfR-BA-01380]
MDLENLKKDIWYGEISNDKIENLKSKLKDVTTEKECFLFINELLKLGDFSVKGLLIQLMNSTQDEVILNLCTRLFCSIATHDDLLETNNLNFLSSASEDGVHTFAASAGETLSYHVVPYLLTLLEEWEDTFVEKTIRNELAWMLGIKDEYYELSIEELGEICSEFVKNNDMKEYYYHNRLSFSGDLVKELMPRVMISLREKTTFDIDTIPSTLSIWSGIKCPIQYGTIITDEKYRELMLYIDSLTKKEWKIGEKYFYGHLVV